MDIDCLALPYLIPVIMTGRGGAIRILGDIVNGKPYHIVLLIFSFSIYPMVWSRGGTANRSSLILAGSFLIIILIGTGLLMLPDVR